MSSLTDMANQIARNNPNVQQVPWAQAGINAILNNDAKAGEQLANNLLQSMGMTRDQAMEMARKNHII